MSKIIRNEKLLNQLQIASGLTGPGRLALAQCINPFPDLPHTPVCFPSVDGAPSIVQVIKKSVNISAPPGLVSPATWDCNIFSMPIHGITTMGRGTLIDNSNTIVYTNVSSATAGTNANAVTMGTINYVTAPSGSYDTTAPFGLNTLGFITRNTTSTMTFNSISADPTFVTGISTINALGFEVHDTTAAIQKQGSVVVYQFPQTSVEDRTSLSYLRTQNLVTPASLNYVGDASIHSMTDAPAVRADCLLYFGSQEWEAKDGVYCVPKLIEGEIMVGRSVRVRPIIQTTTPFTTDGQVGTICGTNIPSNTSFVAPTVPIGMQYGIYGTSIRYTDFNSVGSFFTGLATGATLTLNYIIYIQRRPDISDPSLTTLAAPPPMYDPLFRSIYTACMRNMPPGTMVKNNASGDWFWSALSSVSDFLSPALTAVKTPMGMIGYGVSTVVGNYAKERLARSAAEDAAKKKNTLTLKPAPAAEIKSYPTPTVSPSWQQNRATRPPPAPPMPAKLAARSTGTRGAVTRQTAKMRNLESEFLAQKAYRSAPKNIRKIYSQNGHAPNTQGTTMRRLVANKSRKATQSRRPNSRSKSNSKQQNPMRGQLNQLANLMYGIPYDRLPEKRQNTIYQRVALQYMR